MNSFWSDALLNTIVLVTGVTTLSVLVGVPAAWLVERTDLPGRDRLARLLALPYAIPSFLMAISWIVLANPNVGWIPGTNIYTLPGIIFVEASALYAIILIGFRAALRKMDPALEEAARLSGASRRQLFLRITLPLLKGPLMGGMLAVALHALASFGVPAMIGGPARKFFLTTAIYSLIKEGSSGSFRTAIGIALLMALVALALTILLERLSPTGKNAIVTGKASRAAQIKLENWKWPAAGFLWLLVSVLFVLPACALVVSSFQIVPGSFAPSAFGVSAWRYVLTELPDFRQALCNGLIASLASTAAIIALSLVLIAVGGAPKKIASALSLVCYALPGTALALFLVLGTSAVPGGRWLANSLGILILAYVLKYFLLGMRTIGSQAELIHPSLIEAARLAGASRGQLFMRIWTPLLKPAILAAGVLCLIPAFAELTMSVVLYGPGTENLGVLLFQLQEYADRASAAVVGSLALLGVFILQGLLARVSHES